MNKNITLGDLLSNIESYSEDLDLYLPNSQNWEKNTLCKLFQDEEDFQRTKELNHCGHYQYILGLYDVKDVIDNAKQQKTKISLDDLIKALKFYFQNDAFIQFN